MSTTGPEVKENSEWQGDDKVLVAEAGVGEWEAGVGEAEARIGHGV